jgi:phosphoglycolate phosphatase
LSGKLLPMHYHAIKGLLFDKDGTLTDYHRTWIPINRAAAALAARGDPALEPRLLDIGGLDPATGLTRPDSLFAAGNTREIAEAWVSAGCDIEVSALTETLDRLFVEGANTAVPVTDLFRLLTRLRARGLFIGIASSDSRAGIDHLVDRFQLRNLIDFIAGYDSGYGSKPEPGMLLAFCSAVGIRSSEAAVIGDNLHDMNMAAAGGAGLRLAVLTGTGTIETLGAASDACLPSIETIEDFLK